MSATAQKLKESHTHTHTLTHAATNFVELVNYSESHTHARTYIFGK